MSAADSANRLLECLGGPWPSRAPAAATAGDDPKDGYRIESVTYEVGAGRPRPAMLLVPDGVDADHPAPAVAVWHQHNGE